MNTLITSVLNHRLLLISLAVLTMVAGVISYRQLPVDAFPDVSPSLVQVFTVTEGLAPEEIEQYVTYPIESAMNGLPRLERIRSISNFGLSVVNVYFEDGTDIYFARQVVGERLREAQESIPAGFGEPQMGPISTGMGLVLFYYLHDESGTYSLEELRTMQDWIVKVNLQTIPGVTEVLGIGGLEKQYQVAVSPNALLQYGIAMSDVLESLRANNLNVGAQFIERNGEELVVRSVGLANDEADLASIVLKTVDGTPVYVRDVAEVRIGGAIRRGVQTRNGQGEVVAGMVVKLYGENASSVIGAIEARVDELNGVLPEGVSIVPYYEQRSLVEAAVSTVTTALWQGVFLVVLVLLAFLGSMRPSIVVALSIPFSVLFATVFMGQFGISANLMSLGGLAIAIGMMVDGAIVMVENVDRMLGEPGARDRSRAAIVVDACTRVARPVLFSIAIIVVVFLPLFALEGVEGKTFRPLAYTVSLAMIGSMVYAILVAPLMSDLLMRHGSSDPPRRLGFVRRLNNWYRPIVETAVRKSFWALGLAALLILLGAAAYPFLGSEFTPTLREGTLVLRLTMAPSISLRESTETTMRVERRLMEIPEIMSVVSRIGRGEVGAHTDPINSAEMYLELTPRNTWRVRSQEDLQEAIRADLGELPGVLTNFTQPIQMTVDELLEGVRAELAIKLFGDDLEALELKAAEIAAVVRDIDGAADVQPDQVSGAPQLQILVDRDAIARYGVNVADVQETIEATIGGQAAGQIFEGTRRFDVYARFADEYRDTPAAIRQILVPAPGGSLLPLADLARVEEVVGSRQITRENNQRFITIQLNVEGRDIGTFVEEAQDAIEAEVQLPSGYRVTWGGQFRLQQDANRRLLVVVPITLLITLVLLYASFNSLMHSSLIMLNIPLALVGGV
ncbi:MAG: efflux RND transporter permease subunit, partial [Rhodothermales bacterium]|nr:efflux RND transporter permease subunit [Rhodothermales bacterium]